MAIILGSIPVNDLPEKNNVAIGITLPIQKGNTGYFAQSFFTIDAIKSNIKNLLLTRIGERVMQPEFGTRLWQILFENDSAESPIDRAIEQTIEDAINKWMPFVSIEEININLNEPQNRDRNKFSVSIKFKVEGLQNLETVTFNIS
jgi:phage baseplate assembly protein W